MSHANDWADAPDANPYAQDSNPGAASSNPYAAPASVIEDDFGAENDPWAGRTLATRASRFAARMIDGVTFLVVAIPFFVVTVLSASSGSNPDDSMIFVGMGLSGLLVLGLLIYNLMRLHSHQQTFGKKMMGIQIIRGDLQTPVTLGRIIGLRILPMTLLGAIPFIGSLIGLADPAMIFQESQQCLHDMFADTNVVLYEE